MTFEKTIVSITSFYETFDDVFRKIDDLFQKVTDAGGRDDNAVRSVVDILLKFQSESYRGKTLTQGEAKEYCTLLSRIKNVSDPQEGIKSLDEIARELQRIVHSDLMSNREWQSQQMCMQALCAFLEALQQAPIDSDEQADDYYREVRIVRGLVADCAIAICALQPLSKWSYGTDEYARLDPKGQLLVLLNQAILTDRMYVCLYSLEIILERLDKNIDTFLELDWYVYYVAGFLNFKIHKYERAREYFQRVVSQKTVQDSKEKEIRNCYFRSMLFIAYSYEYSGEFGAAIEKIVMDPDSLCAVLDAYPLSEIACRLKAIMDEICKNASQDSLVHRYIQSFTDVCQNAKLLEQEEQNKMDEEFEILHALSHCLNEFAIRHRSIARKADDNNSYNRYCGKLLYLARYMMRELAKYKKGYLTCYATIHGECQDYHKALEELDIANTAYRQATKLHGKETLQAEVNFFKYYFGLLCNQELKADRDQFEKYYTKYDDADAKCHLKIFEFRHELCNYVSGLYDEIGRTLDSGVKKHLTPVSDSLRSKYEGLCALNPTLYMNANVRAELRLMQRAFLGICALREYLIEPTAKKQFDLQNTSYRFLCVKKDFSLTSRAPVSEAAGPEDKDRGNVLKSEHLPDIIAQAFLQECTSILDCLFHTDSIFILTPISDTIVFQYQTGTIRRLFDLDGRSIFPRMDNTDGLPIEDAAGELFDIYSAISAHYDPRKLVNLHWERLGEYISVIYHWEYRVPSQVLVAENDGCAYIRQIADIGAFVETIERVRQKQDDKKRKTCVDRKRHRNMPCTLQIAELPWLEIIHEKPEEEKFLVVWNDNGDFSCHMLPYSEKACQDRHEFHTMLRKIRIEYDARQNHCANDWEGSRSDRKEEEELDKDLLCRIGPHLETQKRNLPESIIEDMRRLQTYGNSDNPNAITLNEKVKKQQEDLVRIQEITQRYEEQYKNSTLDQAERDYNFLKGITYARKG